ncbi:sugar ABC transporter substrate-binding protein [Salipaludibacillus sp. CUR1]|uniref:sugar ABC transporter substrate-binding protein n=1 Tax=Salipaludibacillus sp. CUR1 TaxID=2820003 RepID=UPI001E3B5EB7|nr:sugar ABC transporter substrate-binding protein [Salipaludibacillus sp. CUR1]MCE7792900.1 sugar ABC transporter substrate-binding protein [Salipaludibacillus sp. CUR1]
MMKFKKGLSMAAGVSLIVAAGCGNDNNAADGGNGEESNGGNNGETTTLSVWAMGEEGNALGSFVESFENEHENIEVNVQAIPWDNAHDSLLTAVASGDGPDVLQLGTTWVAEFAGAGAFLDLSDYKDDYDMINNDDFFEGALDTTYYNDAIYGVPWYVDTRVLFYRTDILEEHGYEEPPQNWEEMLEVSRELADRGDGMYGFDIDQNDQLVPPIFAWQNGWEFNEEEAEENFADPAFREAMDYYHTYFAEGLVQETEGVPIEQGFEEGSKPMFTSGPWMINIIRNEAPDIDGDWDVAMFPGSEKNASAIGGSHLSVFAETENPEEALEFISYMSEPETQIEWFKETNTLPARQSAWDDEELQEDEKLAVFGDQLEEAVAPPVLSQWENIAQDLLSSLERINRGGADLDEELDNFQQQAANRLD